MAIYPPTSTPISATAPVTSSSVPVIPVPTHGSGGNFSVLAKTTMAALPAEVLAVVRDTKHWYEWNTFCPRCTIAPRKKEQILVKEGDGESEPSNGKEDWLEGSEDDGWLEIGTTAVIDVYMNGDGLVEGTKRSRTTTIVITRIEPINTSSLDTESHTPSKATGQQEATTTKGYRIAWKSTGFSHWQLYSERVMEMLEVQGADGEVRTEYACWETFGGVLATVVKRTVGATLVDRFGDYARDLKQALEEGPRGRRHGVLEEGST